MSRRRIRPAFRPRRRQPNAGAEDHDFGVPIPGVVLPEDQWAKTALKKLPPPGPLDWKEIFGREAEVVVDIGCGNGRFTITSALARPEFNFLAIDILPLVLRYATRRANQRGLGNVRFAALDGQRLLADYVAPGSLAEIHLYHPQPYRDPAEREQRILTPEFLSLVHQALSGAGKFFLQTDNRDYWRSMEKSLPELFDVEAATDAWPDTPQGRTRREIYARQHHMTVYRAVARPRSKSI